MNEETEPNVVLAKLRPSSRLLGLSGRVEVEPLYDSPTGPNAFSLEAGPQWFRVRLDEAGSPWDQAHTQVAGQLGIDASDVIFAEPDLVHTIFPDSDLDGSTASDVAGGFGFGEVCEPIGQDGGSGKALGDGFAWHLDDRFSQLGTARDRVKFSPPETRIAHIDTGYYPEHETAPGNVNLLMQRNFAEGERHMGGSGADPNQGGLIDNSGHGTGTIGILAGGGVTEFDGAILGGAPGAEIVPIRVASSVILLRTSSLARALRHAADSGCAVATLSMGGLPTNAWAEAVDWAYMAGLTLVAAAGNRKGFTPPKTLVYPARYDRVIAVTGAMADRRPYKDLDGFVLEGSFGPKGAMKTAMAAYTPNIPWPKFGCPRITRMNGEGTSSATPQVAAAAALWIEHHKTKLNNDWTRVESVRHALFSSALKQDKNHFGNGILRANNALDIAPPANPKQSKRSKHSWAFLRLATGIGIDDVTPREEMFNLELAQLWMLDDNMQAAAPDPEDTLELSDRRMREFMEAVIESTHASQALRDHLVDRYQIVNGKAPKKTAARHAAAPGRIEDPELQDPAARRLRVYAKDPSLASRLETSAIGEVTLDVPWEKLRGTRYGFVGEYLDVEDKLRTGGGYRGVKLDDGRLLATDGWPPSEGNPQFHQQMVYAVAMKTIENFEKALGRPVQWRPGNNPQNRHDDSIFVGQLAIRPHGLQTANAYYSPDEIALLFGYYAAPSGGRQIPGSPIYTCLSHDIVVHETTHAILDGMYRRFNEPSNVDVLAFHEGFADIVALFQQFSMSELLFNEIRKSGGDLEADTMLGKLAIQLGETRHGTGALRSAIGTEVDGVWTRAEPDPTAMTSTTTPHARGALLVAAVFDAFLAIYRGRTSDLLRLAASTTSADGSIHPDLARRLAGEAAKAADHVLTMCIRALDFLPSADVTFFDYLRALITADFEIEAVDKYHYRVAFVEAFAHRGIFPGPHDEQVTSGPRALSADTLRWPSFDPKDLSRAQRAEIEGNYGAIVDKLKAYADACLYVTDRRTLFDLTRDHRAALQVMLRQAFEKVPQFATSLGLEEGSFEVHTLRRAVRVSPNGRVVPQVIVGLAQARKVEGSDGRPLRGGSTLVVDLTKPDLPKYRIVKRIDNTKRAAAVQEYAAHIGRDPLRKLFLSAAEPFAALHQLTE